MKTLISKPADRAALATWLLVWVGVAWFSVVVIRVIPHVGTWPDYLTRWNRWDADRFKQLATFGYDVPETDYYKPYSWPAFFPGYPMAVRAVGVVFSDLRLAGLVVSFVSGFVAMFSLSRLTELERRGAGKCAVLAILVSPCAVFLFAAYSETLFLAFALPAWYLAKKGRWELAVVCAAVSSTVRITGLFLAVALVVEFLIGENGRKAERGWRNSPYLIIPFLPIVAYMIYQWQRTGDLLAWKHAQELGWARDLVSPVDSFKLTWQAAFEFNNEWTNAFRVEIAAGFVALLLIGYLTYTRQWPELVYVGLQAAALMTSTYYLSVGRATLLWFPLWIALGRLGLRNRFAYGVYLVFALPIMAAFVISFTEGQWTG